MVHTFKGGGTYFHLGGGGGAKTKRGTVMSKRALTVYMRILITNDLMKHHCRHKVSFYMLSVVFFRLGGTELKHLPTKQNKKSKGPASSGVLDSL